MPAQKPKFSGLPVLPVRALAVFFISLALLAGCSAATKRPEIGSVARPGIYDPSMLTHIKDFERFPQDLNVYAKNAPSPDLRGEQSQTAARYLSFFFRPWEQNFTAVSFSDATWAERAYGSKPGYDERGNIIPMNERAAASANAQYYLYPSMAARGIITKSAFMRAMPTSRPLYGNPAKAGQGFPFDNYQITTLWIGTPVFISHISADRKWLFCETAMCAGWIEAAKVAQVDESFIQTWRNTPLYAATNDSLILPGGVEPRIGALLPARGKELLLPAQSASGRATITRTPLPAGFLPFPVAFTPKALAALGNQFMGHPYGWGGAFYERDCSLMLHDLFTPFGVWLPRNSAAQIKEGFDTSLKQMSGPEKAAWLAANAKPFRTLIGMPGHVTLYLGEYNGQGAIFHSVWGVRTMNGDEEGRAVLGKVCVTSLLPGAELRDAVPEKLLLNRFSSAAIILGAGGY